MDIEFNPARPVATGAGQPVSRREAPPAVRGEQPFERAAALEKALKEIPLVRTDKVGHAKNLVADVKYPPEETLDRIANLLAIHLKS
jgi:hypothetical protein